MNEFLSRFSRAASYASEKYSSRMSDIGDKGRKESAEGYLFLTLCMYPLDFCSGFFRDYQDTEML